MILKEACRQFLKHCGSASNLSQHTMRAYCSDLDEAQRYFGFRKPVGAMKKEPLRQYIHYMREERQLKETTIKRRLASLKLVFKWAMREKLVVENPFDSLNERIRLPKRLPRALDRADQAAQLAQDQVMRRRVRIIEGQFLIRLCLWRKQQDKSKIGT